MKIWQMHNTVSCHPVLEASQPQLSFLKSLRGTETISNSGTGWSQPNNKAICLGCEVKSGYAKYYSVNSGWTAQSLDYQAAMQMSRDRPNGTQILFDVMCVLNKDLSLAPSFQGQYKLLVRTIIDSNGGRYWKYQYPQSRWQLI